MDWKRTGSITLRSGDEYVVMRYLTHYKACHGKPGDRTVLGEFPLGDNGDGAKAACEAHSAAEQAKKNPHEAG